MKAALELLREMIEEGVISGYAIFGAVAQMRYTEAVATMDADILVSLPGDEGLDAVAPIYAYCRERGYLPEGEAIRVGDWPVQFIPVFDDLSEHALETAESTELEGSPAKVVSAQSLALMALKTGRAKDHLRLEALLTAGAVSNEEMDAQSSAFGLTENWHQFREKYL